MGRPTGIDVKRVDVGRVSTDTPNEPMAHGATPGDGPLIVLNLRSQKQRNPLRGLVDSGASNILFFAQFTECGLRRAKCSTREAGCSLGDGINIVDRQTDCHSRLLDQ